MKPSVYLETTIPSYLGGRPSRDLIVAANQEITRDWWSTRRGMFELYLSQIVLDEAAAGDPEAVARRRLILAGIPALVVNDACRSLAERLLRDTSIPPTAATDALHVAVAAVHRMNYLLTWNCTHIANAALRPGIESVCAAAGYLAPVICTPQELMEVSG